MHHFNWSSVVSSLPTLWTGAIITFKITLLALVFGILWGTVLAYCVFCALMYGAIVLRDRVVETWRTRHVGPTARTATA